MNAANVMSTHKAHRRSSRPVHSSHLRLMGMYAAIFAILLLLFWGIAALMRNLNRESLIIPDEKAVAANLLSKQLTGPRYFQIPDGDVRDSSGVTARSTATAEPHITTEAARLQVDGIVKARYFNAEQAAKVQALIDRLKEPAGSRLVGAEHVNLLRLNLALDALP